MNKYKHIFFDLDRTLWDFEASAELTFKDIYYKNNLYKLGVDSFEKFTETYKKFNDMLWVLYRKGEIHKEVLSMKRFQLSLEAFNIFDDLLAARIAEQYISQSPQNVKLFPYTHEILQYLFPKYQMHLLTNGFEEVQQTKIRTGNLKQYFKNMITSEEASCKKPEAGIFKYALNHTGATINNSIMIGDDLAVDIIGARNMGIDQIFVNYNNESHEEQVTYEVDNLKALEEIL